MNTLKIKTSELTGAALDWAVAIALGGTPERPQDGQFINANGARWLAGFHQHAPSASYCPSTNWAQCGPLIDQFGLSLDNASCGKRDELRKCASSVRGWLMAEYGPTPQVAICRAVVAGELGEEVEVPAELVQGGAV